MGPPFPTFFIIHPRKKKLNQNDVEFDLSIGHALVHLKNFLNNKQKIYSGIFMSSPVSSKIHIYLYILDIKHYFHQIS